MSTSLSSYSCLALAILALTSQFGCIALSIPSERLHDPSDHGGLFGDWKTGADPCTNGGCVDGGCVDSQCGGQCGSSCGSIDSEIYGQASCLGGGPLESDPFDPAFDADGNRKPKKEEIPWPRFHPVPTRPVFGVPISSP